MLKILSIATLLILPSVANGGKNTTDKDFYYTSEFVEICNPPTALVHMPNIKGEPYFLKYYNSNSPETYLTIVIWGRDIPDLEIDPVSYFSSENRCIVGNISSYKGRKQLIVRSHKQLINK